jgi:hypothetical protein
LRCKRWLFCTFFFATPQCNNKSINNGKWQHSSVPTMMARAQTGGCRVVHGYEVSLDSMHPFQKLMVSVNDCRLLHQMTVGAL